jgi:hypothetical protein
VRFGFVGAGFAQLLEGRVHFGWWRNPNLNTLSDLVATVEPTLGRENLSGWACLSVAKTTFSKLRGT